MQLTKALTTNIKLAFRNLFRDKTYGLISVIGLSVAMACAILVLARVIESYRHVEYYTHGDRTYRVLKRSVGDSGVSIGDWVSGGSIVALRDFPEVELAARASASLFTRQWVRAGDLTHKQFFCRTDPELIELLELAFVRGHLSTDPLTAVVTEDTGRKFFGDVDPVGQTLSLLDSGEAADYRITGLLKNLPEYAHIKIDVMTASPPGSAVKEDFEIWEGWSGSLWGPKNYVRLAEGTDPGAIEERLNDVMRRSIPSEVGKRLSLHLQPMSRAYLYGESDLGDSGGNPMDHLQLLAFITLVVIAVASANFVNLTAARTVVRTREVAARRAVGASRFDIFLQFLVESMVVSALALVIGFGLAVKAPFTRVFGDSLSFESLGDVRMISGMTAIAIFVGLSAGIYPSIVAARIQPTDMSGSPGRGSGRLTLRGVLIVSQLACAAFFIVGAFVIQRQMAAWESADIGLNYEHVLTTRYIFVDEHDGKQEAVKAAMEALPGVVSTTTMWPGPGAGEKVRLRAHLASDPMTKYDVMIYGIDPDFFRTYGVELLSGRNVGPVFTPKDNAEFILNETAVKRFGWSENAASLGQALKVGEYRGMVIGVVGDFHHRSFQYAVEPMVLLNWSRIALGVRVRPENLPETIASMKNTFARFFDQPADFAFVEDWYGRKYSRERRQGESYAILAWAAVFLAGLGVFGLAAFETEQRRREVGVRKVLGASIGSIVTLFWKRDVRLVLVANLVAWPVEFWLMDDWLSQFAYRIDLSLTPFALAGSATGALFLAVVGLLAIRIGRVDPAETLRSE